MRDAICRYKPVSGWSGWRSAKMPSLESTIVHGASEGMLTGTQCEYYQAGYQHYVG